MSAARTATKKSPLRRLISLIRFMLVILSLAVLLGFGYYCWYVSRSAAPKTPAMVDGIVVLTGPGGGRLETGAALLAGGHGERLLISGVDPSVSRDDIAAILALPRKSFDCCVDLDRRAYDTVSNARESASWARAQGYQSLIIVTSDYHMPRTLLEFSQVTGDMRLIAYPVPVTAEAQGKMGESRFVSLLREYGKLLVIYLRHLGDAGDPAPLPVPSPEDAMRQGQMIPPQD